MSENPYRAPDALVIQVKATSQSSVHAMSKQTLGCPSCHKSTISAGRAAIYYPAFKVRCTACNDRICITLPKLAKLQFHLIWFATISTGFLALGILLWTDPFEYLENLAATLSPKLWNSMRRSLGQASQPIAIGTGLLILFLAPLLIMATLAFRKTLHLILTTSNLRGNNLRGDNSAGFTSKPDRNQ